MTSPLVSVVIPARNEADDIADAIACVALQSHPLDRLEVIVVDGGSTDATSDTATRALLEVGPALHGHKVVAGRGATPANLNDGLAAAQGEIVVRVDARSRIPVEYVSLCVDILTSRPDVAVVGGSQVAVPRGTSATELGIARGLNNRFAMGFSRYRRGAKSGPTDTVYLGAFRTDELRDMGGWNENFPTNQDFELNRRMSARGEVWFEADLEVGYLPRKRVADLFRQYQRFGRWKVRYWRMTGDRPQPRQIIMLAAPLVGVVGGALVIRRRPRALIELAPLILAAGLVVDEIGTEGPPGGTRSRLWAVGAMASTTGGWLLGVIREAVRPGG